MNTYGVGFVVYFAIGLASAIVEWTVFGATLAILPPILAACAGFVVATFANFLLSRRFAFVSRLGWYSELGFVMLASGAVFVWNLAVFYVLYRYFAVPLMIAKMTGTLFGFLLNYATRQFWICSRRSRFPATSAILQATLQGKSVEHAAAVED
jgi:putative flippase GtrA